MSLLWYTKWEDQILTSHSNTPQFSDATISGILELFTITSISDKGEASEKTVHVMAAQQFVDHGHIDSLL